MRPSRPFPALCCVLALFVLSGCGDIYRYASSGAVGWALKQEIRDRRQTQITLSQLTRFDWDEMIVFGSYTSNQEICRRLQLDEAACKAADLPEPLDDGLNLLVFRLNGKIVHHETHLAYHGEFRVDDRISFTPDNARFAVEAKGTLPNGERQLILPWQPPTAPTSSAKQMP